MHATDGRTELILWITSHVEQHGTKKWGVRAHLDPTLPASGGSGPQDPHRIAATDGGGYPMEKIVFIYSCVIGGNN